jgi:hypothetical protein
MMIKRVLNRFNIPVEAELVSGLFASPARAIALKQAFEDAVKASFKAVHDVLSSVREEIVTRARSPTARALLR